MRYGTNATTGELIAQYIEARVAFDEEMAAQPERVSTEQLDARYETLCEAMNVMTRSQVGAALREMHDRGLR